MANCLNQFYRLMSKVLIVERVFQRVACKIKKINPWPKPIYKYKHVYIEMSSLSPRICLVETISRSVNGRWVPTKEKKWQVGGPYSPPWPPARAPRWKDDGIILKRQPIPKRWESSGRLGQWQHPRRLTTSCRQSPVRKLGNFVEMSTNAGASLPLGVFISASITYCCVTSGRLLNLSVPQFPHV